MNETNENKLVPKLRFPEFVSDGEWKEIKLIDFADKNVKWSFTGGPFGSNLKASDYTEKGVRIIQLQNIGDGEFMDDYKIYTSIEKANELLSSNIYSGDLILSKMGDPVGRACIIPGVNDRFLMASDGIRLVVDKNNFSKYFVYSLINSAPIREKIEKKATGSTRKRIGLDDLREVEVFLPKKVEEQQKIADCLSSLDEVITAESEKLKALKEHKKGLLQNLFPQAGETVPKLRFKEFEDSGEWRVKRIDEFAPLQRGFDLPVDKIIKGIYPVVFSNGILKYHNEYKVKAPGVVTGRSGTLGKVTFVERDFFPHNTSLWVTDFKGNYPLFVYYYFVFIGLEKFGSGSGVPTLNRNDVHNQKIFVPSIIDEQEKIASCLSSTDDLINAQIQKIESLKLHKKGLLQGLFPNVNQENL